MEKKGTALSKCVDLLRSDVLECETALLGGKQSPNETWDFRFLRPLFKRYL